MASRRLRSLPLVVSAALLLVVAACGPSGKNPAGPGLGKESAAAAAYPVVRRLPGNVTMFAAAARLDAAAGLLRDAIRPFARVDRDADLGRVDEELRRMFGFSPISAADLADAGFAVDRNVAVYSTGLLPTFLVPVADAARLGERLGTLTREWRVVVSEHRGLTLTAIKDGDLFVAWTMVDDWWLVHIGSQKLESSTTTWVNELLDTKATLAFEPDLDWAWQQAGERKAALGLVRGNLLATAVRQLDRPDTRSPTCDALNQRIIGGLGRAAVAATIDPGKLDAQIFAELTGAGDLQAHTAPAPDATYLGLRGEAGLALSLGVDLPWLGGTMKDLQSWDCGILPRLVRELELDDAADPIQAMTGTRPFTSYHVAVLGGQAGFSGVDLQAVAYAHVADEGAARNLLGQLGQAQRVKVGGTEVTQVSIPGAVEPLEYVLGGGVMKGAMGRGLMARLLGAASKDAPAGARELVALAVRPDKIPDLVAALQLVGGGDAEVVARLLGEFKWFQAAVASEPTGVRVTGGFELR
jgi:hypothetical protein